MKCDNVNCFNKVTPMRSIILLSPIDHKSFNLCDKCFRFALWSLDFNFTAKYISARK